jgi:hypothetical protein
VTRHPHVAICFYYFFPLNEFVAIWKNSVLKERYSYQEHFIDLCRLDNHLTDDQILERLLDLNLERSKSQAVNFLT